MSTTPADIVRQCYEAYTSKDRGLIESILADDFTFTSPLDDNISREEYFKRCWPNSEGHVEMIIEQLLEQGDEVYVTYRCKRTNGVTFRNTEHFKIKEGQIQHVDVYFGREEGAPDDEAQVRELMEGTVKACRDKDVDALIAHYADDMVAFDLINPLQYFGSDQVAKRASEWLFSFDGPIDYELKDLEIVAGDGVAHCHSMNHVVGTNMEGQVIDMWWRQTAALKKVGSKWQVTHTHSSVPFDMETGKASMGLKP